MTFQVAGAQSNKPTRYTPIWTDSFFHGLYTQRNPLRGPAGHIENKYYPTFDAMIDGSNVEISTRLTPIRRYGNSVYNSQTFTNVDSFYSFNLFNTTSELIKVMVDTSAALYDGTGPSTKNLVFTKSAGAGQMFMQSVGNVLYFGDGIDQGKWVQTLTTWLASTPFSVSNLGTFIIDTNGNIEQLTNTIVPIATVSTDSAIPQNVTITYTGGTDLRNVVSVGLSGPFSGLTTATFLNGIVGTVTARTASSVTFSTTLTGHASYGPTADTGLWLATAGGSPVTGTVQPTWNVTVGGTTNDNTAQWTNRGSQTENLGIAAPTTAPTIQVGASNVSWQANTFYSNAQALVDTQFGGQTNIWSVTVKGKSGASNPFTSNPTSSVTTVTDGTVTWTCVASTNSGDSAWSSGTAFAAGHLIVASGGGTNCLFQLGAFTTPYVNGTINVTGWNSTSNGAFNKTFPAGAGDFTFTAASLSWHGNTGQNTQIDTINGAGAVTGATDSGHYENWEAAIYGNLHIRVAGQYSFNLSHDDGAMIGFGGTSQKISGTLVNPPGAALSAVNGYPLMAGNNNSGSTTSDPLVVNFPTAGDYPFEIDWTNWQHASRMLLTCNGQTVITTATPISGAVSPVFPAFSTAFAPNYPTVSESAAQFVWSNIGPITDYSWKTLTQYLTTTGSKIIDPNNNTEDPYEAGVTGTNIPTFHTGINQLTNDNPNLIWINQGPAAAPPAGTLSTFNGGWTYYIALVNTLTNTVSNVGPASASTGNFIGSAGVKVSGGLPTTIDTQVDYVAIFRTLDGGATPFLIPGTGNTVYTVSLATYQASGYTDTTPDSGLNLLIQAPTGGQNTPPGTVTITGTGTAGAVTGTGLPTGAINFAYHLGRLFFSIGNVVYWSSGPDTPVGNGIEGVGPLNNATFPSLVKRLVPTSVGLFVYTVSDIYIISGNGTAQSPLFPLPYLPGKGINSYNALAINGTLTYIFTTTSTVMTVDPNGGFWDLGFPIGDQFTKSNWSPANAYLTWHESGEDVALYVADGSTGWFRGNPTPSPESGQTWSPFATIQGGVKAVASIETTPGVKKLLLGSPTSGPILARDLTTYADNGTTYTAFFTIGSLVLAQPGQLAELAFITTDSQAIGTKPAISVRLDEISGNFDPLGESVDDPPKLAPSQTTYAQRFYLLNGDNPALCRHMQIRVDWPSENAGNEMLSCTLFGSFIAER